MIGSAPRPHYTPVDLRSQETFENKRSYFQWAEEKAQAGKFKTDTDKEVWTLHANGLSMSKTAERIGFSKAWVVEKVHRIENYLKEQAMVFHTSSMSGYASIG